VVEDSQHRRHHQIAGRETVAIEIWLLAKRPGEGGQTLPHELHGPWAAQLRPLLVCVEEIDQRDIHDEGLDGIERRDEPLRRAYACAHVLW
jgi:hypothetical protein